MGSIAPSIFSVLMAISNGKPFIFDVIGQITARPVRFENNLGLKTRAGRLPDCS